MSKKKLTVLTEGTIEGQPDLELLDEVRLSRVYFSFKSDRPVGLVTAFYSERTQEENLRANETLASTLRSDGFGLLWVDGVWVKDQGLKSESRESETSLLVVGNEADSEKLFNALKSAAEKFEQKGFVFKGHDSDAGAFDSQGDELMLFNYINMKKLSELYARSRQSARGKRMFLFQKEREQKGFIERLIESGSD